MGDLQEDFLHREEKSWPISIDKSCPMIVRLGPMAVDQHINSESKTLVKWSRPTKGPFQHVEGNSSGILHSVLASLLL